jgi:hypothetical protein
MRLAKAMRALAAAVVWSVTLVAALSQARAGDPPPVWKDGWTLNTPGQTRWVSGSSAGSSYFPSVSATPFSSADREPYGFNDFSIGHTLGFGRELGLGNMQATLGVRMAAPLAGNWFTPALDPRRYLGVGPRLGLEGNQPLQSSSWVVEWKVGASILSGDRAFGANAGVVDSALPNFSNSGSYMNVDGLLGLSYWFDTASKLTLGYRADYFSDSSANLSGTSADKTGRLDHGPMIRFSIQK